FHQRRHDPRSLCRRAVHERDAAFSDSADDRQNDTAASWRHAGGLEHLLGFLSDDLIGGVPLCSWKRPLLCSSKTIGLAYGFFACPVLGAAAVAAPSAVATGSSSFVLRLHDAGMGCVGQAWNLLQPLRDA